MSDFWWGFFALPLTALTIAAAAAAIFGSWLLIENWSKARYRKLEPIEWPEELGGELELWTAGDLGHRGTTAATILAGAHVRRIRIGTGVAIFAWGKPEFGVGRKIHKTLQRALSEIAKENR